MQVASLLLKSGNFTWLNGKSSENARDGLEMDDHHVGIWGKSGKVRWLSIGDDVLEHREDGNVS